MLVSGHEVAAPKPAPDAYLEACAQLDLMPSREIVVLEDSPTGVASGLAAGLTVLGVPSVDGVVLDDAHEVYASLAEPRLHERARPRLSQCASSAAWAGGRDSSASEVSSSTPREASSSTSVASSAERA